jgi:hypothetical protein
MAGLLEFCSRCVLENIEVRSAAVIPRHLRPTDDLWIGVAEGTRLYPVLNIATVQKRLTLAFFRADEATNPPATSGMMSRDAMSAGPKFVGTGCEWKQRRDESVGHRRQHYGKQAKQSTPLTSGIVVVCGNPLVAAPVTLHGHCDRDTVVGKVLVPGIAAAADDLARLRREGMVELVHCWVLGATDTAAQVRLFLHNPQWRLDEIFLPALHWGHSLTVGDHVLVGAAPARDCFTENIPLVQTGRLLGRWNTIHSVSPMEWNTKRCSHRTRSNEILRLSRPPTHPQ